MERSPSSELLHEEFSRKFLTMTFCSEVSINLQTTDRILFESYIHAFMQVYMYDRTMVLQINITLSCAKSR